MQHRGRRVKFPPEARGLALCRGSTFTRFIFNVPIHSRGSSPVLLYKEYERLKETFDLTVLLLNLAAKFN